ncbi:MAG TPA: squalene--hopene cyclase [Polyangia bacterium]|jgi:squalene-hopene/tetraprenyl-beta-curcumene cyclase
MDAPVIAAAPAPDARPLFQAIEAAQRWLLARQDAAGFWCAELEGDTTLESYIILLEAFFGRRGSEKSQAVAHAIREEALPDGGWPQYPEGPADVSVSVLSYFALKLVGDAASAPHMQRARAAILRLGGAARANSYTKYHLAFFGEYPWADVPAIPPEMVFLPGKGPFTVYDMSSWSRTIFVPLAILYAAKPTIPVPASCGVAELFAAPEKAPAVTGSQTLLKKAFFGVDRLLKGFERLPGASALRRLAVKRAAAWMIERLEDSDGLSAILPAMANATMALKVLGYGDDHPLLKEQLGYLDGLLLGDAAAGTLRMQPCLSPVWDTVLSSHALGQAGLGPQHPALQRAAAWLLAKQTRRPGDWSGRNGAPPGGWYFEHRNEFYPDVDDTCMALMVLRHARADGPTAATQDAAVERGLAWMLGMQNSDGGWASFDRDNDKRWLTEVPFADHNAMIDPSTADITGRVLESLSYFPGYTAAHPVVARALTFLRGDQNSDGAWYGRWGVNYLYGTWQVLRGLACIGEDLQAPYVRRAVRWLLAHQNPDGGWGETIASYDDPSQRGVGPSTPSQTAWALMGLLAAESADAPAVVRGVQWLRDAQTADGTWAQANWTGTGFPKVFYLNYHYYRHYFPLMALGQYARARQLALPSSA